MKQAILKSAKAMWSTLPIILGTILLLSLLYSLIPKSIYAELFSGNIFLDSFVGGFVGSIAAGNPITSYVIGGELREQGVSLLVVTAFLVSWVTVGFVQLPAEILILKKKFAILRNITAFFLSIIVAIITILILQWT